MSKRLTLTFDDDTMQAIEQASRKEVRSIANFVNYAAKLYAAQVLRQGGQLDIEHFAPGAGKKGK